MNTLQKWLKPNVFMMENYFNPAMGWVMEHEFLCKILSILFIPVVILYVIWYMVSLIEDMLDFFWFKFMDYAVDSMEKIVEQKEV